MTVVDRVVPESERPPAYRVETITLGWEERTRVHGRRTSDSGLEFATSLPRGTILRAGDCLLLDAGQIAIVVRERDEPVFVIEPRTANEWALYAYHIGNRHQPVMITGRALVCPDVPGVEQLLRQHQMPYTRASAPFTPVAGTAGHQH